MSEDRIPTAAEFDEWYADMAHAPVKDEIQQRHLGLPPELLSTSLLTWDGLGEVVEALRLGAGDTLVDLACGRGGYGLEAARRTGAALVGVDYSAEAVRQAQEHAARLGRPADVRVGDLTATGLPDGFARAVMCVDAIQFAAPPAAAYAELRRIVSPGGRVALTCWEAVDRADESLSARVREADLRGGLTAAGFVEVDVRERPEWRRAERAMWEEAAALDEQQLAGDPALQAFHDEGVHVLPTFDRSLRVLGTATAPS